MAAITMVGSNRSRLRRSSLQSWVNGFAPLSVGADVPAAVQEFSRTLFNMRPPDISLFVSKVPASMAIYLRDHLGGRNTVEMLDTEGHLPHLSASQLLVRKLRRALCR